MSNQEDEPQALTEEKLRSYVNHSQGLVDRRIFIDEQIYKLELERVFARSWLYLGHQSQLARPGRFISTRMGDLPVILCLADDDSFQAFANYCPACDTALARADEGTASEFICPNHGYHFNLYGQAINGNLPLTTIPRIESYRGWLFGNFDQQAVDLETFLGDIRWGLDLLIEQGDLVVASVTKWTVECNWKIAAESSVNDIYHGMAHVSAFLARDGKDSPELDLNREGFTVITEYGHGLNAELMHNTPIDPEGPLAGWRQDAGTQRRLGAFRMNVSRAVVTLFPNVTISTATRQMKVWHPKSARETEIWLIAFSNPAEPADVQRAFSQVQNMYGPSGLIGQDDAELWKEATRSCLGITAREMPLNYQMGVGKGTIIEDELSPPRIETLINEHRELWFYRNWLEAVLADDWQTWQKQKPQPTGAV